MNSRGVMRPPVDQITEDGYDLQFGTNVLGIPFHFLLGHLLILNLFPGPFYFSKLLLPTLTATAKLNPGGTARVITTSSSMHMFVKGLKYRTLKDSEERKRMKSHELYSQSKFVSLLSTFTFWFVMIVLIVFSLWYCRVMLFLRENLRGGMETRVLCRYL